MLVEDEPDIRASLKDALMNGWEFARALEADVMLAAIPSSSSPRSPKRWNGRRSERER
jgi:hypothetical protein